MSDKEFTGKTIDEAVEEGLKALSLTREQAEITVLEEPVSGFLRSKKAKVRIEVRKSDGVRAAEFLDELLEKMNFHATGELAEEDDKVVINLITTNSANIIGYRGEVLDALQTLAGAVANIGRDDYKRVVVDCENYRGKREDTLINLANRLAEKAVSKARKLSLEPMNPYERRIIHSALAENTEVKTISEGKEPNRFIVIIPSNAKAGYDRKGPRKPYSKSSERSGDASSRSGSRGAAPRADGGYNRDRGSRPYGRSSDNKDRGSRSSFSDRRETTDLSSAAKPAKKIGFGTYLGNSFKD